MLSVEFLLEPPEGSTPRASDTEVTTSPLPLVTPPPRRPPLPPHTRSPPPTRFSSIEDVPPILLDPVPTPARATPPEPPLDLLLTVGLLDVCTGVKLDLQALLEAARADPSLTAVDGIRLGMT